MVNEFQDKLNVPTQVNLPFTDAYEGKIEKRDRKLSRMINLMRSRDHVGFWQGKGYKHNAWAGLVEQQRYYEALQ